MKFNKLFIIWLAGGLFILGCKKKEEDTEPDWMSSKDLSIADALWQDLYKIVDEEAQNDSTVANRSCATVAVSPIGSFPTTLTIDFGSLGCMGTDGRYRKGIIQAVFTGPWRDSLSVVTVTPQNYYVDGYLLSGTKTIENKGRVGGFLTYDVQVNNGKVTDQSNAVITWNSNVTYTWIEGDSTTLITHGSAGILDDVYTISGTYSGVNRQGNNFTAQTTSPIRKELDCRWPVSGVLTITPQGLETRTINFGTGSCDNYAIVSVAGYSKSVQMR